MFDGYEANARRGLIAAGLLVVATLVVFWWDLTRGIKYGSVLAASLLVVAVAVYSFTAGSFSEYLKKYENESSIRRELDRGRHKHFDEEEKAVSRTSYTRRDEEKYIIEPLEEEGWEHLTTNQEEYPEWANERVPENIVRKEGPEYEYVHYDVREPFVYMLTSTVQETPERFDGSLPDGSGFHVFRKSRIKYMSKFELVFFVVMSLFPISFLVMTTGAVFDMSSMILLGLGLFALWLVLFIATIVLGSISGAGKSITDFVKRLYPRN